MKTRRILSLMLVMIMVLAMVPMVVAASPDPAYYGVWEGSFSGGTLVITIDATSFKKEVESTVETGSWTIDNLSWTADVCDEPIGMGLGYTNGYLIEGKVSELTGNYIGTSTIGGDWDIVVYLSSDGTKLFDGYEEIEFTKVEEDPGDVTAPTLSAGSVTRTSHTAATVGFTSNEAGTAYYLIVAKDATAPTSSAVAAGTAIGAVTASANSGKSVTLTTGAKDIYVVVKDAANNISTPLKIAAAAYSAGGGNDDDEEADKYTVKFETNGGSKIDSVDVVDGKKVKRPTNPTKDGYTFSGWYSDKALKTAYDFDDKVEKNITLYAKWLEKGTGSNDNDDDEDIATGVTTRFVDVKANDWFYGDVEFAVKNGLFNGISATEFGPNLPMTRAMIITVLARHAGVNTSGGATWYSKAVEWGMANDITDGSDLNGNVTREQMATLLHRYMTFAEIDYAVTEEYRIFADENQISGYAKNAIQIMNKLGIINGRGGNIIDPKSNATRAEVAAMMRRFVELAK